MPIILSIVILTLCVYSIQTINVNFTGFEEGNDYTYKLNGFNTYANLTCAATAHNNESIFFQTTWRENGSDFISERETLHFRLVAEYTGGDKLRRFYCMATFTSISVVSREISVQVLDYSTIRLNYNNTNEVRTNNMNQTLPVLVPVLSRNVLLTCNAEGAGWRYTNKTTNKQVHIDGSELNIDVVSLDWMVKIDCTRKSGTNPAFTATSIVLIPIESGLALEKNSGSLVPIGNNERLAITQYTTVLCATSDAERIDWYYRDQTEDGIVGNITGITSVSVDKSQLAMRGFVKLIINYPIPADRTGYYSCVTYERISHSRSRIVTHIVEIVNTELDQNTTTTTLVNTTLSTQISPNTTTVPTQTINQYTTTQTISPNITTQTISPNITTQTITPNTTQTIAPNTTTQTISPNITTQTISPNITTQTISPNITTQTITPNTTQTIAPNTTTQTISPNTTTQTISPNITTQTISPNITTQTISPNITTQTISPNTTQTIAPNTTTQTISTNITTQTISPNITTQTISPNITTQTITPNTTQTIAPNTTTQTISPNITTQTITPNITTQTITPNTTQTIAPNTTTQTISPNITTQTISPNTTTQTISPNITTQTITLNTTQTITPNTTTQTISPNTTTQTISPNITTQTITPNTTQTIAPNTTTQTISPNITTQTISPNTTTQTISPNITTQTITPNTTQTIAPNTTTQTISPNITTQTITPNTTQTIAPNTTTQTISPNITTQTISPNITTQTISPNITTQTITPNTTQTIAPNTTTQTISPNTTTQTISPNITTQTITPNTTQTIAPITTTQTISTNITTQTISTNITTQTISTNITKQTISPNTTQTITPNITTQTISPNITTQTISPNITTQTITPNTTQTIAPNTTTQTISPNITTQTISPNITTQTISPNITTQTITPNTTQTIAPNTTTQTISPNTTTQTISPNITTQTITPNTTQTIAPNTTTQTIFPSITTQTISPNITTQTISPNITTQTITPNTTQTIAPNTTTQTIFPNITTQTISPNITTQTITPNTTQTIAPNTTAQTIFPNITTQTISPNITRQTISPNITTQTITPNTTQTIAPNTTTQTIFPNITTQTISPNITRQTISPNITTQTISPNITTQTISPNITTQTISPNITTQTISSNITTLTISPNITIQTISPNTTQTITPNTTTTKQTTSTTTPPATTTQTIPPTTPPNTTTSQVTYTIMTTTMETTAPILPALTIFQLAIIGAALGLILIFLFLCILITCLCCFIMRKSKPKPWKDDLPMSICDDKKISAKYTPLKDIQTPAAVQSTSIQNFETLNSSHIKTTKGHGHYIKIPAPGPDDVITELQTPIFTKGSVDSLISESTVSSTSTARYQDNPNGNLIELQHYKQHLDKLLLESRMEREFDSLGGHELRYNCNQASLKQNFNKNKYKSIFPYDKSRVLIKDISSTGSDYINASHIPGFYIPQQFIAAQAPKSNTINSFWNMVWELGLRTIVTLTNLVELDKIKCTQYWPAKVGDSEEHGVVHVCLQKEEIYPDYIVRDLLVSGVSNRKMRTRQYHYTAWSNQNVPQLYNNLLSFIQTVKSRERKISSNSILVHCSAGVGRTGIFIALYNIQDAVGQGVPISVYRVVNEMREHRPHMVQTFSQYKYIYLAVLEIIMGCTSVVGEDYRDTFSLYLQAEQPDYLSVFRLQFKELSYQTDKCFNNECRAAYYPDNVNKNVADTVVPYDSNRVILSSPTWDCEYVNASYISDDNLIATPLPRENTIREFLQLIYQLDDPIVVVMLSKQEYEAIQRDSSNIQYYWGEERGSKEFGAFKVETDSIIKSPFFIQYRMKVYSDYDSQERRFCQYVSYCWDEGDTCTDTGAAVTLLDHVSISLTDKPDRTAIFSCNDSIGKTGVMLAVYLAVIDVKGTGNVDLFQTVKKLRCSRKNMVPTIEHYISCHSLIDEYFRMNMT